MPRCSVFTDTVNDQQRTFRIISELFPAILRNKYYCKPDEKTWHLSVNRGPVSGGALGRASTAKMISTEKQKEYSNMLYRF